MIAYERAAALDARSADLARSAVARLAPQQRTLAARVLAARFVKRCAEALAAGSWSGLPVWIDEVCERYADVLPAPRVLASALEGVERALGPAPGGEDDGYAAAREHAMAVLARPRVSRLAPTRAAIDEIDVVIDALLTRLDQTDVLTAEHSRAVSSWCARLGKQLGWSKSEVAELTRGGLIHDIGKVTTPPEILGAPRRLNDEEFAVMQMHAAAGAEIVAEIALIRHLVPAVRHHHERFDGHGYPDGLKFDTIPDTARVVAVADAFNAMIGRRPYRPPLAPSSALERLVEARGEHFDPDAVDAMVEIVQRAGA